MTKVILRIVIPLVILMGVFGIVALFFPNIFFSARKGSFEQQARIVIPQNVSDGIEDSYNPAELIAREDSLAAKAPLLEGEAIITLLNGNFEGGPVENQFVAYRNLLELDNPIYLCYIEYDEASRSYKRAWNAQTAATRPGTISLYTMDLLGDRSVCVLLSGVNSLGEHTLTIFRKNPSPNRRGVSLDFELFSKIAEFRIDGTITVREAERSQAYQLGLSSGQSYTISAFGRDFESANIMDQVEIVYAYNERNGLYEQTNIIRIPGTQIEQRRVRELLGNPAVFEEFVTGLWYYMTPEGTIDRHQYIYFDPPGREIIFYGDETQQVFNWQNSTSTRLGIYVSSQNISITTLRRSIDIELESLESIRVRVFEDVRLNIKSVNAPWDGSYKKAGPPENSVQRERTPGYTFIEAQYDGSIGKLYFSSSGNFELVSGSAVKQGKYSFFYMNNMELLELRSFGASGLERETYLVAGEQGPDETKSPRQSLSLLRVRIGARGIERLHEGSISLTLQ